MKQFFENYGGIALGILALLVLIAMITPIGNIIKTSLQSTVHTTATGIESQTDTMTRQMEENFKNAESQIGYIDSTYIKGNFVKGNIVTINNTQYKVLSTEGTKAKVVSMENVDVSVYNATAIANFVLLNGSTKLGLQYKDSLIDTKMANYYNSLPEEIKEMIVAQNIKQSMFTYNHSPMASCKVSEIEVGNRMIYILDIQDLFDYFGYNPTVEELNIFFFDTTDPNPGNSVAFRSADVEYDNAYYDFFKDNMENRMGRPREYSSSGLRPSFVINLGLLL